MGKKPKYDDLVSEIESLKNKLARLQNKSHKKIPADSELHKKESYSFALHETALAITKNMKLTDLLEKIVERAGSLIGTPHGYIYMLQTGGTEMKLLVSTGRVKGMLGYQIKMNEGAVGIVWRTGEPLAVNNYSQWEDRLQDKRTEVIKSIVAIPLKDNESVIGVFGLVYTDEGEIFDAEAITILNRFGELASIALCNSKLYLEQQNSAELFRTLVENSPFGIYIVNPDGDIEYLSPKFSEIFGYTGQDLPNQSTWLKLAFPDPAYRKIIISSAMTNFISDAAAKPHDLIVRCKDGNEKMIRYLAVTLKDNRQIHIYEDVTPRAKAEEALIQELAYLAIYEKTTLGMINRLEINELLNAILDCACSMTGTTHSFIYILAPENEEMEMSLGQGLENVNIPRNHHLRKGEGVVGRVWLTGKTIVVSNYAHYTFRLQDPWAKAIESIVAVPLKSEHRVEGVFGLINMRDFDDAKLEKLNGLGQLASIALDSTRLYKAAQNELGERKRVENALRESERRYRELSITDGLTNLFNSRHFYQQIAIEVKRTNRLKHHFSLLMMDIDDFKRFNDIYGHQEGDSVLRKLGKIINQSLRESDMGFRYGGEEFAVILPETTYMDAILVAERIRKSFAETILQPSQKGDIHNTISIGVAQYILNENYTDFIKRADNALYEAKNKGKNIVIFRE